MQDVETRLLDGEKPMGGEALAAISTGLVRLHRRFYGKGPTRAKTYLCDHTIIVSVLHGGLTPAEQVLIAEGDLEVVHSLRRRLQTAMEGSFKDLVEELTGRKVITHMSQSHPDPDLAYELLTVEVFFLASPWKTSDLGAKANGAGPGP